MHAPWRTALALGLWRLVPTRLALGHGMVVPEVYHPQVEEPNAGGVENLVIETTFNGTVTNFAWA